MKKKLVAISIMALLFLSSCAKSVEDDEDQKTITNPITRIELSGKNNLIFK